MFRISGLVLALVVGLVAVGVARGQTVTTLTSFNGSNGENPEAGLTLSGGTRCTAAPCSAVHITTARSSASR